MSTHRRHPHPRRLGWIALPLLALIAVALLLAGKPSVADPKTVDLYKDPNCGCCAAHGEYLEQHGFDVTVHETADLAAVKERYGIPRAMQGCHTAVIDGYAVEGHVPVAAIQKLLAERPDVTGIAVPGMPTGSPGMGGPKTEPLVTWTFGADAPAVYLTQ